MTTCQDKNLFFFLWFYLFIFSARGREEERERNINMWLPLELPLLGPGPQLRHVPWLGNWTRDPLVCRLALNPLSHTRQGNARTKILILSQRLIPDSTQPALILYCFGPFANAIHHNGLKCSRLTTYSIFFPQDSKSWQPVKKSHLRELLGGRMLTSQPTPSQPSTRMRSATGPLPSSMTSISGSQEGSPGERLGHQL